MYFAVISCPSSLSSSDFPALMFLTKRKKHDGNSERFGVQNILMNLRIVFRNTYLCNVKATVYGLLSQRILKPLAETTAKKVLFLQGSKPV